VGVDTNRKAGRSQKGHRTLSTDETLRVLGNSLCTRRYYGRRILCPPSVLRLAGLGDPAKEPWLDNEIQA
jgi:hypothetical protein